MAIYYYRYVMQRTDLVAIFMVLLNGSTALGIFLFSRLSKRIGKKKLTMISFLLTGVFQILIYFADYENITAIMILTVLTL